MANRDTALSMGAETLEAALRAVKETEKFLFDSEENDAYIVEYSMTVYIDGEIIGRVQIEDGSFAAFIPNGNWCGFNVEAMG